MKILILTHDGEGQDGTEFTDACFVVPDEFQEACMTKLGKDWTAETWQTKMRFGKSTKRKYETIPFADWLAKKFMRVEFIKW